MRIWATIFLVFVLANAVLAQNLKKGFKYLSENDFDRAKVIFDEARQIPEIAAIACYGNAMIFKSDAYRSRDLYRAFDAISKSVENLDKLNPEQLAKLSEYISGKEEILKQKEEIDLQLFQQVKNENTVAASERFIKEASGSTYLQAVKALYATQRFAQVEEYNTIMAYQDFINEFPEAREVQSAWQKIYSLAYQQVAKADKLSDYEEFVKKYPNSPQVEGAKKKILEKEYEMVLITGTDDAFERFIQKYPSTSQAAELRAKQMQINYVQAIQLNSVSVYNNFLRKFPESPFVSEITLIRDSLAYLEAKQLNTAQAYKDFINKYPNAAQISKVMSLQQGFNFSKAELAQMREKEKFASRKVTEISYFKIDKTDSTKKTLVRRIEYDNFGNVLKDWEKSVSGAEIMITKTYSSDGTKLLTEQKTIDGSQRYFYNYYYNSNDLLDSARKLCYQPCEDGLPSGSFLFVYKHYPDRNIQQISITGQNFSKTSNFLINNQKLISQEVVTFVEGDKTTNLKVNYQWDFYDRLIQKSTFSDENTISAVATYFYDKKGNLIKYSAYDALGKIRKTNTYSQIGLLESIDVEYPNEPINNHFIICKYTFEI